MRYSNAGVTTVLQISYTHDQCKVVLNGKKESENEIIIRISSAIDFEFYLYGKTHPQESTASIKSKIPILKGHRLFKNALQNLNKQ